MISALFTLALAAPPEGLDLEDYDLWEGAAQVLPNGPAGCWVFEGTSRSQFSMFTRATMWTRSKRHDFVYAGPFKGRFEAGRWVSFEANNKRIDDTSFIVDLPDEIEVHPMMGRYERADDDEDESSTADGEDGEGGSPGSISVTIESGTDSGEASLNMIDGVLDALEPDTMISYIEWSDTPRGVRLLQDAPLSDGRNADGVELRTFFPDGEPFATEVDLTFPRRMRIADEGIALTILEPQMRMRGKRVGDEVLPMAEGVSAVLGLLGFTVGFEQTLAYTKATSCPPAASPAAPAPTAAPEDPATPPG